MGKMSSENMFEFALRAKMRFPASKAPGGLSLEQLWDVPLRSNDGFNLNAIAKDLNKSLKTASEENFVDDVKLTTAQVEARRAFDIVKYVIDTKLDEETKAKNRAARRAEEERLLGALAKKQDAALDGMSEAAIKKRIQAIREENDEE